MQYFDGNRYYRNAAGYFQTWSVGVYMHRAVWEHHHGTIPEGYEVHHVDHDRANNAPENLEVVEISEHRRQHMLPRASAMAAKTYDRQQRTRHICRVCDGEYLAYPSRESIYCSKRCKNRARYWHEDDSNAQIES